MGNFAQLFGGDYLVSTEAFRDPRAADCGVVRYRRAPGKVSDLQGRHRPVGKQTTIARSVHALWRSGLFG